jgi:hypothetical protein
MNTNGYRGNTRKRLQSTAINCYNSYNLLQKLSNRAKMPLAKRKELQSSGSYDGRIPYCRRDRATAQSVIRHGSPSFARKEDARLQDLWFLESKQDRLRCLVGKTEEHSRRAEIKKAGINRHETIKNSVAVRLPLTDSAPEEATLRQRYPVFRVHDLAKKCKVRCATRNMGMP